jgi:hypothetical protein
MLELIYPVTANGYIILVAFINQNECKQQLHARKLENISASAQSCSLRIHDECRSRSNDLITHKAEDTYSTIYLDMVFL